MCMCVYIYIYISVLSHTYYVNANIFWVWLIAINRFDSRLAAINGVDGFTGAMPPHRLHHLPTAHTIVLIFL